MHLVSGRSLSIFLADFFQQIGSWVNSFLLGVKKNRVWVMYFLGRVGLGWVGLGQVRKFGPILPQVVHISFDFSPHNKK